MESLKEKLLEYKNLTDKLINAINNEQEEEFKKFLSEKQSLINSINELKYDSTQFKEIASEFKLVEQDKNLHRTIEEKKSYIKNEMKNINAKMNATIAYNNDYTSFNFLNKKI